MSEIQHGLRSTLNAIDIVVIVIFMGLFFVVPFGFTPEIAWLCLAVFYAYVIKIITRKTYVLQDLQIALKTELTFTIFYYILFFLPYQKHLLGMEDYRVSKFLPFTYPDGANPAMIMSVVGFVAFDLGLNLARERVPLIRPVRFAESVDAYDLFDKIFVGFFALLIAFYRGAGLVAEKEARYSDPGASSGGSLADGVYVGINILCVVAISRAISTLLSGRVLRIEHWLTLAIVVAWTLRIAVGGDRNGALQICLAAGGGAAAFLTRIRWPSIIMALILALFLYKAIEIFRTMPTASLDGFLAAVSEANRTEPGSSSFGNTTATLRATFEICPSQVPYAYGFYKLWGFLGVVPFIRGFINSNPGQYFTTSAEPLTYYLVGSDPRWGVGSNIISDIYLDFGPFGVPIVMALVGVVISGVRGWIVARGPSAKRIFLYTILLALVSEMPRYSLDGPVRYVFFGLVLFWLYELIFVPKPQPARVSRTLRAPAAKMTLAPIGRRVTSIVRTSTRPSGSFMPEGKE